MKTVNVVAAVILKDDEILIRQRGDGDFKDMWGFPGGKIELGEAPENALIREIKEELSVTIKVGEWISTIEHEYPTFHLIIHAFLCSITSGELELKGHEAAKWITIKEMNNVNWIPADKKLIENMGWRFEFNIRYMNSGHEPKGDLYSYVSDMTKTLELMDKFEGKKKFKRPYKRIILQNTETATIGDYLCEYHLIIERYPDFKHTEGDITFSEFKREKGRSVYNYCSSQLREALKINGNILKNKEFYFIKPYYLRAQNSGNRQGYGWVWDWSGGVGIPNEGTYYGDTDDYAFVGVQIESVVKKQILAKSKNRVSTNPQVETTIFQGKKFFKIYKSDYESYLIPCKKGMTKEKAIEIYRSNL